jgi:hypothetical protein
MVAHIVHANGLECTGAAQSHRHRPARGRHERPSVQSRGRRRYSAGSAHTPSGSAPVEFFRGPRRYGGRVSPARRYPGSPNWLPEIIHTADHRPTPPKRIATRVVACSPELHQCGLPKHRSRGLPVHHRPATEQASRDHAGVAEPGDRPVATGKEVENAVDGALRRVRWQWLRRGADGAIRSSGSS